MKRLTLIRHAQAEDAHGDQADLDRVLTRRGTEDAAEMARRFKQRKLPLAFMVTSTASRAVATADIFGRVLQLPSVRVSRDDRLYTAGPSEYLKVLRQCNDEHEHIIIVAHNPGITEFADKICSERAIEAMPTATIVTMELNVTRWAELQWNSGTELDMDYPNRCS